MTITSESASRSDVVAVLFGLDGIPLAVRLDGSVWAVDPRAATEHWFERRDGWAHLREPAIDSGDSMDFENWRVKVRSGAGSSLRIFHLQRDPRSAEWLLAEITDGN
jgi:hypothetical protein